MANHSRMRSCSSTAIGASSAPSGTATILSALPGVFTVVLKAFDAEGNEGDATQTLTFLTPPNGLPAPVAGLRRDQVTPVVTLPTAIVGTANTADFLQYTLQYSVEGQNHWTTFAIGHHGRYQRHAGHDRPDDDAERLL